MRNWNNIPKELLLSADVMNTVNGGMSVPSVDMDRNHDHYRVDVKIPGVSPDSLKVDVDGQKLTISQLIDISDEVAGEDEMKAENVLNVIPIPFNVDVQKITANYDERGLHVILPYNEFSNGYKKNIRINTDF